MVAGAYDITIEQGATFRLSLVWEDNLGVPIDLTGYTARMQLRQRHSSDTAALTLTSTAGDIVLGGALGTIVVTAAATVTDDIPFRAGVYDLEVVSGSGFVTRLIEGAATITPEVTR
jgi:hypothetical protein